MWSREHFVHQRVNARVSSRARTSWVPTSAPLPQPCASFFSYAKHRIPSFPKRSKVFFNVKLQGPGQLQLQAPYWLPWPSVLRRSSIMLRPVHRQLRGTEQGFKSATMQEDWTTFNTNLQNGNKDADNTKSCYFQNSLSRQYLQITEFWANEWKEVKKKG